MKNLLKIIWLIGLLSGLSIYTSRAAASVEIYNDWDYPVNVKEGVGGLFSTAKTSTDENIQPNKYKYIPILNYINYLQINYQPNGSGDWVQIKGCSRGTYSSKVGLKIYITGKDSDPRVPVCTTEVITE